MKQHFSLFILVFSIGILGAHMTLALSGEDIISHIQKRAQKERLFEETKDVILRGESSARAMNQTRIMNMLQEVADYNIERQRPLPPILSYILEKKDVITHASHPELNDILEAYAKDRYVRYMATKTQDEKIRDEKHFEAITLLPEGLEVPTPRTSKTYQSIVVDISDQRIYAFEDGILVGTSPVTTGKRGFSTARGDFEVKKKQTNRILTSPFKDTNIRYRLHVDYWIQFHKGFGIHDACNSKNCWREEFGTPDYVTRGSHGCVNTPHEFVGWLYDWALPQTRVSVIQ